MSQGSTPEERRADRDATPWHTIVTAVLRDASGAHILVEEGRAETETTDGQAATGPASGTGDSSPTFARLPRLRIDQYQWVAESQAVAEAFAPRLGFRPWILRAMRFTQDIDTPRRMRLALVFDTPPAGWTPSAGLVWRHLDELATDLRAKPPVARPHAAGAAATPAGLDDASILADLRHERAVGPPARRRLWALEGGDWRARATAWADESLAANGRRRTGPVTQQRTWGISCVLRIPTDEGLAYLKAAARLPLFVKEGPFTAWLADAAPEHAPRILGVHDAEGWLLTADFGPSLRPGGDPEAIDRLLGDAMRTYGRLQRALAPRRAQMRALGAHPRDLRWLAAEIEPLLADPLVTASLDPAALTRLRDLAPRLRRQCRELASLGLPDSLLHGDLHPGNMARTAEGLIFFDWTDAAIGHPFLDPFVATDTQRPERTAAIRDGYLEAWAGAADEASLTRAWELARPLTMLYQATSYRHLLAGLEPMARPGLDGGLSGWLELLVTEDLEAERD